MSHNQPLFGLNYLSPSTLATAALDVQNIDTSTPINGHVNDDASLSSIDFGETHTPTNIRNRNKSRDAPLHSILKNNPNRSLPHPNTSYYSTISDGLPAQQNGNAGSKPAKVLFLPTKEVVSYATDYHREFVVDLTELEEDLDDHPNPKQKHRQNRPPPSMKSQLWTDPSVPYTLLLYLQLFCNIILVSVVMYLVYLLIVNIRADVRNKIDMYTSDAIQEISRCSRDYYRNKCSTEGNTRAPALEKICTSWEKCMNRDPQQIGLSKITAETFADIVNGFFRPISWKSLFMFNVLLFGSFIVTNLAFGTYRRGNATNAAQTARIAVLEQKLKDQEKLLENRQLVLPATPPSQFISSGYERILDDSVISYNSPLVAKQARG